MAINDITLGDDQPLSNDLKPIKVGGEASIINVSSPTPDGSVDGEVEIKGNLKAKDTQVEGNFSATSIEEQPQFRFHSRNNVSARLDVQASANQNAALRLRNNQGYFELKRQFSTTSLQFTDGTNTPLTLDGNTATFAGDVTVDTDTLHVDSTNNTVGIGTTSPSSELHIKTSSPYPSLLLESTGASANIMRFTTTDGTFTVGQDYDDNFSIANASNITSNRVFTILKSNGNLGLGTTSPTTTLDVEGTVSYKHTAFSTAGPTDNIDVSGTTVLEVDTSSNNVVIGGFTGGVQGQILYIVKTDTANFIQLEHNEGGGSQDIFLTTGADERVVGYGGYTLYCNGTSWFSLSNPTGGADAG